MRKALTAFVALAAIAVASAFAFACGADGGTTYDVTVHFNESVTQEGIDEVGALLRGYDENVEFMILEIFPPIGSATLETDTPDFCATVVAELEPKSYVRSVECSRAADGGDSDADQDAPGEATSELKSSAAEGTFFAAAHWPHA